MISKDKKELAFLYDLYIVPGWRECFDRIVNDEVKLPEKGMFLDAGCGTGSYAIELAFRGGAKATVIGVDSSQERLALARGKAEVAGLDRVTFQPGSLPALTFEEGKFDLVIGDLSMLPTAQLEPAIRELRRVAKTGATVALKLATQGSFDELFSFYWEALFNLDLLNHAPRLETLLTERLPPGDAEDLAKTTGLKQVRSVTCKEEFDYKDAEMFFNAPLINHFFLDQWLAILPNAATRQRVQQEIATLIDNEHSDTNFAVSIKATLLIGRK